MTHKTGIGRDGRAAASEHVRCRQFDGELVMLDLEKGQYFSLDVIGSKMWDALAAGKSPAEIATALALEYQASESDIVHDCIALADDLLARGLLVKRES